MSAKDQSILAAIEGDTFEPHIVFSDREVERIEKLIDDSSVVDLLDPLLPAGGRPRNLSLRTLLVGLAMVPAGNAALYLKQVA